MKTFRKTFDAFVTLALLSICVLFLVMQPTSASAAPQLGVFVYENLEGMHTSSSTFGTSLGAELMDLIDKVTVSDNVPLQSNETVRLLDELTKDRKVVVTTLTAAFKNGGVDYPTVTFADDDIKFTDLTWKVDVDKVIAGAKEAGLTHALIGTCTGLVTAPHKKSAAGKRELTAVTASVNVRLFNLTTGEIDWMNTYRHVVSHTDARVAYEQATEAAAAEVAGDLNKIFAESAGQ